MRRLLIPILALAAAACESPGAEELEPWSDLTGVALGLPRDSVTVIMEEHPPTFEGGARPGPIAISVPRDRIPEGRLKRVSVSLRQPGGATLLERWLSAAPEPPSCYEFVSTFRYGRQAVWSVGKDRIWVQVAHTDTARTGLSPTVLRLEWGIPEEVPHVNSDHSETAAVDCDWVTGVLAGPDDGRS